MTELEKQLNTRDGAEDFRDFLEKTSEDGLRVFELWLTLNGYKKEVEKFTRLHDFTDAFAKWNMRCTKALIEKYFKDTNCPETKLFRSEFRWYLNDDLETNLNESYRRLRKWPTQRFSEDLINSLLAILRSVSDFLDNRYFSIYQKIGCPTTGSNRIKEHLPLKNMLGQKRKCSLFGHNETHNNSEHLSPASDFTSSDNYSSITEFTNFSMNSTSADSRKLKRRNKQIRRMHLMRNRYPESNEFYREEKIGSIRNVVPRLVSDSDLANQHPEKFAQIVIRKLNKLIESREDDCILSEHLDRVMKTPRNKSRPGRRFADSVDNKVGDWLANQKTPRREPKRQLDIPVYAYGSNGISETNSTYEYIQFHDPLGGAVGGVEPLSTDSGLSSIRVEESADEERNLAADDSDVQELNGLKRRLIEETEGELCTKILYHFENEKFVIRVPGWPPTLASFQQSMHCHGDYRYFVRQREAWVEVTERNEPVHAVNGQAEVKVISKV